MKNKIPTAEERFESFFKSFPRYGISLAENWKKEIIDIAEKLANDKAEFHLKAQAKAITKITHKNGIPRIVDN